MDNGKHLGKQATSRQEADKEKSGITKAPNTKHKTQNTTCSTLNHSPTSPQQQ